MSDIQDAIEQIVTEKQEEVYIRCESKRQQESIRVMCFNEKRKLPKSLASEIAISKETVEDQLTVKVYRKPNKGLFVLDSKTGEMKPLRIEDPDEDPVLQRQLELMRKDGVKESEIQKTIENWKREKKENE